MFICLSILSTALKTLLNKNWQTLIDFYNFMLSVYLILGCLSAFLIFAVSQKIGDFSEDENVKAVLTWLRKHASVFLSINMESLKGVKVKIPFVS